MKIAITSDHRGYTLKEELKKELSEKYEIIDLGTNSTESVDYPKYGIKLGETVLKNKDTIGIAICGTGIGMSIILNKINGIMCAKVATKEEATLAKEHNNANVIALSSHLNKKTAIEMINAFITSKPLQEEKYQRRINQIKDYENAR